MLTEKYKTYQRMLPQFAALNSESVDADGISTKRGSFVKLFGNFGEGRDASASVTRPLRAN